MASKQLIPLNLQLFADNPDAGGAGNQPDNGGNGAAGAGGNNATPLAIDYDKIQQMLNGTLAAKEDTALKAYFKQQGLSQQEAEQAMTAFKEQKAKNQPDVQAIQQQLVQAQQAVLQAKVDNAATMAAITLGLDSKTIPYVLKMADMSKAVSTDGAINNEELQNAIKKVLEDIPALKPQAQGQSGFMQVGANSNTQQQGGNMQQSQQPPTNVKRWNRWR